MREKEGVIENATETMQNLENVKNSGWPDVGANCQDGFVLTVIGII